VLDQRFDQRQPPAAPGDDEAQLCVGVAVGAEQRVDLRLEQVALGVQRDRRGRALQAIEVGSERVRAPAVEADHLEHAVAAVEAVVLDRDRRLGGWRDHAVDGCELVHGHRPRLSKAARRASAAPLASVGATGVGWRRRP